MASILSALQNLDLKLSPNDVMLPRVALCSFEETIAAEAMAQRRHDTIWRSAIDSAAASHRWWRRLRHVAAISVEMTLVALAIAAATGWYLVVVDGILFVGGNAYAAKVVVLTIESAISGNLSTTVMALLFTWQRTQWWFMAVVAEMAVVAGSARAAVMVLYNTTPPAWFSLFTAANYALMVLVLCIHCARLMAPFLGGSPRYPLAGGEESSATDGRTEMPETQTQIQTQPRQPRRLGRQLSRQLSSVLREFVIDAAMLAPMTGAPVMLRPLAAGIGNPTAIGVGSEAARPFKLGENGGDISGTGALAAMPDREREVDCTMQNPLHAIGGTPRSVMATQETSSMLVEMASGEASERCCARRLSCLPNDAHSVPPDSCSLHPTDEPGEQTTTRGATMAALCDPLRRRPTAVWQGAALLFAPHVLIAISFILFTSGAS